MNITTVDQLSGTACDSSFFVRVEGHGLVGLRLWIVAGGTPALAFYDYSYTRRFPVVERYSNAHWQGREYEHQTRDPWGIVPMDQTPSFNDLPNGLADVETFLEHTLPLREKRDQRMALLPQVRTIRSRRMHDTEEQTYVWAKVDIREYGVSPVIFESKWYAGRCEPDLLPEVWSSAAELFNRITIFYHGATAWENLSDADFQAVHNVLWDLYNSKDSTAERLW